MKRREPQPPSLLGFHLHIGTGVIGCGGPRVEVSATEHGFLVAEAKRLGCSSTASLQYSHPLLMTGYAPADSVFAEVERLLGEVTVDDRARHPALRIRAAVEAAKAEEAAKSIELPEAPADAEMGRSLGTTLTLCGVGSDPYEEPRWR